MPFVYHFSVKIATTKNQCLTASTKVRCIYYMENTYQWYFERKHYGLNFNMLLKFKSVWKTALNFEFFLFNEKLLLNFLDFAQI